MLDSDAPTLSAAKEATLPRAAGGAGAGAPSAAAASSSAGASSSSAGASSSTASSSTAGASSSAAAGPSSRAARSWRSAKPVKEGAPGERRPSRLSRKTTTR